MLQTNKLSYWEKNLYFNNLDFVIIGAGIVGYSTALSLREKYKEAKILILERGYLPTGASTKNAGFACFGSPSELMDDLTKMSEDQLKNLVYKRYSGLRLLLNRCGKNAVDYQNNGSVELFTVKDKSSFEKCSNHLEKLNHLVHEATNVKNVFTNCDNEFGFRNIHGLIKNKEEGQINTGFMMKRLFQLSVDKDIHVLFGIAVEQWESNKGEVILDTNVGAIRAANLILCTNGLSNKLLPELEVKPARAQVLITKPLQKLNWQGTFHYDAGYYYFRNIDNRVLLGGGRNLDFDTETTTDFEQTRIVMDSLRELLHEVILPSTPFEIDHSWSGIMGVGKTKEPIVKLIQPNVACGIRLGGMGVALGSLIGQELSELF